MYSAIGQGLKYALIALVGGIPAGFAKNSKKKRAAEQARNAAAGGTMYNGQYPQQPGRQGNDGNTQK